MNRRLVESTDLKSVGYDSLSRTLEVEFQKGGVYQYLGVPESVHLGLMAAPSHGKYFNQFIKGRYPFNRLE